MVQCKISGDLFWLRMGPEGGSEGGDRLTAGVEAFVTNLQLAKSTPGYNASCKTLSLGRNSTIKFFKRSDLVDLTNGSNIDKEVWVLSQQQLKVLHNCSMIFHYVDSYLRYEMAFSMQVFDWYVEHDRDNMELTASNASEITAVSYIHVLGVLKDRRCVDIRLPMYLVLLKKLSWLKLTSTVQVLWATLMEVDRSLGILWLSATDHTVFRLDKSKKSTLLSPSPHNTSTSKRSFPTPATSNTPNKRRSFVTPSKISTSLSTPAIQRGQPMNLLNQSNIICDEEKARFTALRNSQSVYQSVLLPSIRLECIRQYWDNVFLKIVSKAVDSSYAIIALATIPEQQDHLDQCIITICSIELLREARERIYSNWTKTSTVALQQLEVAFPSDNNWVAEYALHYLSDEEERINIG